MRVVLQRVSEASVTVDETVIGTINAGLLLLVGITDGDSDAEIAWMARKVVNLRVFSDDDGKMNRSLLDVGGACLIVSQFTLYGDCRKGNRPSYIKAARPEVAIPLYEAFIDAVRGHGVPVETGEFGAMMDVTLVNDGPVTLLLETGQ